MADFTQEVKDNKAVRLISPASGNHSLFVNLIEAWTEQTAATYGIADPALKEVSYKARINFTKAGIVVGYCEIGTPDEDAYVTLLSKIDDELAEEAFGANAAAVEDPSGRKWWMKLYGRVNNSEDDFYQEITYTGGETAATGAISCVLTGYKTEAARTAVEAWADAQTILNNA